jgi:protein phosphatase
MKLSVGVRTDPGPRRGANQDSALAVIPPDRPEAALLIVADGMGGHKSGERASQEAVRTIHERVLHSGLPVPDEVEDRLCQAIVAANQTIHRQSQASDELEGMGCTVVAALALGGRFWIASVGDSRAYLVRSGTGQQLTEDHTWVNARVREGLLTRDEAEQHSLRHVLDRALGPEDEVEIDVLPARALEEGDVLVLCSDGVSGVLNTHEIAWAAANHTAQEAADVLIERALNAPAQDNITVAVLRAGEPEPADPRPLGEW